MQPLRSTSSLASLFRLFRMGLTIPFLFLLLSCNDLAVFLPGNSKSTISELNGVSLTDEGRLSLEWASKLTNANGTYDIFLLEVDPSDGIYRFTDKAVIESPLTYESVSIDTQNTPRKLGQLLDNVNSLSFVVQDILTPDQTYAIEIVDSRAPLKLNSKIVLVRIDFEAKEAGTASSEPGYSHLVWNKVTGANRYEVYADAALTIKIGDSDTNELRVKHPASGAIKDYYVKAFRGLLPAQGTIKISLSESLATVVKVQALNPDGRYRAGDTLDFAVTFSQKVTSFGEPSLPLITSLKNIAAPYLSGSGSDTLLFRHLVESGDDVPALRSGALLGGEYVDESNLTVAASLPVDTSPDSLKRTSLIAIDTLAPTAPSSIGYNAAYSSTGNITVSWTPGSDLNFLGHRLKLCSDAQCSLGCGSEQLVTGASLALVGLAEGSHFACVRAEDTHGNSSATNASLTAVRVDSIAPRVSRVLAQSAAGTYAFGESITLAVQFDETIIVTGDLRLTLAPGGAPHDAVYASGSGTNTLLFQYNVQADDQTSDLDYGSPAALAFAGAGSLVDQAGNNAILTLPAPGDPLSLSGQSAIALDGIAPTVTRVYAVTGNGSYAAPSVITLAIEMNEAVQLTDPGNLRLALATGVTTRFAIYTSGNGSSNLQFTYTVMAGDENSDLDYVDTSSLAFNGTGTLRDSTGNAGNLTLPAPAHGNSLGGQSQILVDAVNPSVARVYATSGDGVYGAGTDILISVEMSEAISLTDANNLRLQLETGTTDRYAIYDGVSGAQTINFRYAVILSDVTGDLNYLSTAALAFNGAGTIRDTLSNDADLALPDLGGGDSLSGQSSISIDTSDFRVNRVYATTAPGVFNAGETIEIAVEFNKIVTVTDSSNLKLTLATGMIQQDADYLSGSGSATLLFNYVVQAGDTSSDLNYYSSTSLSFHNGSTGTVKDPGNQVATMFLPSLGNANSLAGQSAIVIDTLAPAVARVYGLSADGSYRAGTTIQLAVELTEDVTITGIGGMTLTLATDGGPQDASYLSQPDDDTLVFEYTVQAGDTSGDLDYTTINSLAKSGTLSLKDAAGNETTLTLPAPADTSSLAGQSAIILDTTPPEVLRVYSQTADGTYKVGTTLAIKVEFDEVVTVAAPSSITVALATGVVHNATLVGGSGTSTLDFSYPIQAGDTTSDLDYDATSSLVLTGGTTLKDGAGNDGVLTLPAPMSANSLAGQANLVLDTSAPTISRVYAQTTAGSYTAPSPIDIVVEFNEIVNVSDVGNLRLALAANAAPRSAVYLSGTGTDEIVVRYLVQTGDASADLNYEATNSLSFLVSGSAQDAVGNTSLLTLPATASGSSLAGQSAIVIDAIAPNAPVITAPADNATVTSPVTSISGTAEANSTIEIFKDSVSQGTALTNGAGNWSYTLTPTLLNGTYTLAASARDSLSNTSSVTSHSVTVAIPPPTANAGADIHTSTTQNISGSSTNAVSRLWTKLSGPGAISFGSAGADTTSVSADQQGVYVLRLTATNANGDAVSDDMTFTWDTTAPTFRGLQNITQHSSTSARVFWAGATDTYTDHKEITYELCFNTVAGSCASNFVVAHSFASNVYEYIKTGLTPDVNYEFLVRAVDKAGNTSMGSGAVNSLGLRNSTLVVGGGHHFCALLTDQTVKCWGANNTYQLGLGGTDSVERQNPVSVAGLSGVKKIAAGINHTCAIMNDDTVKCWGENTWGNLGDGSLTNRSSPVTVGGLANVEALALGWGYSCALIKVTGAVSCWGLNQFGRLGDGTTTDSPTPVAVTDLTGATLIAAGNASTCALMGNKTVKCWGRGTSGELGNNAFLNSSVPVEAGITNVEHLDLGEATSCAVVTGGAVKCWGNGGVGRLGTGSLTNIAVPADLPNLSSGVAQVSGGWTMFCALMLDGTVQCWGDGGWGQMANDSLAGELTPRAIPGFSAVTKITLANDTICATSSNNAVRCIGRDDYGQAGDSYVLTRVSPAKVEGLSGTPIKVETGIDHSCALMSNKTVQCWGSNEGGMLGDPSLGMGSALNTYHLPKTVVGLTDVEILKVGAYHSCAVLTDTTVRCWGRNGNGTLGNNSSTHSAAVQTVVSNTSGDPLTGITDIFLGLRASCAIGALGKMYCWGESRVGMLGDGRSAVVSLIPVESTAFAPPLLTGALGFDHLCVIRDDGPRTVQCVGSNAYHQLADGTTTERATPYSTTTGALAISSEGYHTCILTAGQQMKCWGFNGSGELGQGNIASYSSVQTVSSLSNVTAINLGRHNSCARLANGSTACWGENDFDRLGLPNLVGNVNQTSPQPTTGLTGVAELSSGFAHSCALMLDSTIKCWGYNNRNQTGVNRQDVSALTVGQEVSRGTFGD